MAHGFLKSLLPCSVAVSCPISPQYPQLSPQDSDYLVYWNIIFLLGTLGLFRVQVMVLWEQVTSKGVDSRSH